MAPQRRRAAPELWAAVALVVSSCILDLNPQPEEPETEGSGGSPSGYVGQGGAVVGSRTDVENVNQFGTQASGGATISKTSTGTLIRATGGRSAVNSTDNSNDSGPIGGLIGQGGESTPPSGTSLDSATGGVQAHGGAATTSGINAAGGVQAHGGATTTSGMTATGGVPAYGGVGTIGGMKATGGSTSVAVGLSGGTSSQTSGPGFDYAGSAGQKASGSTAGASGNPEIADESARAGTLSK